MTRDALQIMQHEDSMPAMAREIAGLIGMPDTLRRWAARRSRFPSGGTSWANFASACWNRPWG